MKAVHVENGTSLWTRQLGGRICSTAYATEGHIYVGAGDGKVYCLDSASGNILWEATTLNGIASSPVIAANTVLIGSEDCFFYALYANTGPLPWKYHTRM